MGQASRLPHTSLAATGSPAGPASSSLPRPWPEEPPSVATSPPLPAALHLVAAAPTETSHQSPASNRSHPRHPAASSRFGGPGRKSPCRNRSTSRYRLVLLPQPRSGTVPPTARTVGSAPRERNSGRWFAMATAAEPLACHGAGRAATTGWSLVSRGMSALAETRPPAGPSLRLVIIKTHPHQGLAAAATFR